MKKLLAYFTCAMLLSCSVVFASEFRSWTGDAITFTVINNTDKALEVGPAWGGSGALPKLLFPDGSTVAPHATLSYVAGAPYVATSSLGTLITGIFLKDGDRSLDEACATQIYVDENTDNTFEMTSYPMAHFLVATTDPNFSCTGHPVDFDKGGLTLVINPSAS